MTKQTFLDLGWQPIANGFIPKEGQEDEFSFNLQVAFDDETCLVTQQEYVAPEKMFHKDYAYRGSMSLTMVDHFQKTAKLLSESLPPSPRVLEIGSNDGVFLNNWDTDNTYAVEPCFNFAEETNALGYRTYSRFWNNDLSKDILAEHGSMDLVFAANCMCHIPDLQETFQAVANVLEDEGLFVFEDPSLARMINLNSYDQIYDEHAHIFSVIALKNELERVGLSLIRVDNLSVHGGSNRIWAAKTTSEWAKYVHISVEENITYEKLLGLDNIAVFDKFSSRVAQSKQDLLDVLYRCKENDQKVISYGATSKSTTVFNYCGIDDNLISYITDTTPEKQGKLAPGSHIPVVAPKDNSIADDVNYVFLGAWNFVDEISKKEKAFIDRGGKFITHVPLVRFV
tara:strand:- start:1285 stop:2478 length:1194 start_codon:yes stop_codon:yes gene_type:complete